MKMIIEPKTSVLPISSLLLDPKNPRLEESDDQREIISKMLEGLGGNKLFNLAEDIIENGLNPADLLIVIPHEIFSGKFIVLEGNRRLTAIKLLIEPSLLDSYGSKKLKSSFDSLSSRAVSQLASSLACVIFPTREDASHWIELRHTGENDGVGIVGWNARAVARFKQRAGKKSIELQVIDFVEKYANLPEKISKNFANISVTNLRRLLKDPHVREALGLEIESEQLKTYLPRGEANKGLARIITDLALKKINVNDIRNKSDRQQYLESFTEKDLPDFSKARETSIPLMDSPEYSETVSSGESEKIRSKRLSKHRKNLIPSSWQVRINNHRINSIYRELKLLHVDDFPNAIAVLFRVFLEVSVDDYLARNNVDVREGESLSRKLERTSKHMENNGVLPKKRLKPINVARSTPNSIYSINTFHAYVHNPSMHPKPSELKLAWDEFELFFTKLWSE